jgi:branched-chain amino acid transport system permease protein
MKIRHDALSKLKVNAWSKRILVILAIVVYPLFMPNDMVYLGFVAIHYAIIALGLNVVVGWTGLLDLGAAGFVAIGAYVTAIFMTTFGLPVPLVLLATLILGFFAGILLGIPTLRHRSDYFAILTLGFAELVALVIRNWTPVTRGAYGFSGIPGTVLPFASQQLKAVPPIGFYYFAAIILIPLFYGLLALRSSRIGRQFHIIKHSEVVAGSYGVNIFFVKALAFGISAAILSVGGFFWASYQRSIVWNEFGVLLSCMLLTLVVVGGIGNPKGVMIGGAVVGTSQELLRKYMTIFDVPQNTRFLIFSLALIIFIRFRPKGIFADKPKWITALDFSSNRDNYNEKDCYPERILLTSELEDILTVKKVSKSFGGNRALASFSVQIKTGETVALIGPNGSGKTTLLNLISGLLKPDEGSIYLAGDEITHTSPHNIAQRGLRRSFQDLSVFDDISVIDNIYLVSDETEKSNIPRMLKSFSLSDENKSCSELSYGDKKKLDLARVFLQGHKLKLALLDEPTAGLSHKESLEIVHAIRELKRNTQMTIMIISHDMMFLDALQPDSIIVLKQGQIYRTGPFNEIRNDAEVHRLFWGNVET